jgi:hypothetical protein
LKNAEEELAPLFNKYENEMFFFCFEKAKFLGGCSQKKFFHKAKMDSNSAWKTSNNRTVRKRSIEIRFVNVLDIFCPSQLSNSIIS